MEKQVLGMRWGPEIMGRLWWGCGPHLREAQSLWIFKQITCEESKTAIRWSIIDLGTNSRNWEKAVFAVNFPLVPDTSPSLLVNLWIKLSSFPLYPKGYLFIDSLHAKTSFQKWIKLKQYAINYNKMVTLSKFILFFNKN